MCKHVAAVLYGVGARLDQKPELLFRLRAVQESDLLARIDTALPLTKTGPAAGNVLETDDVAALFGLDMAAAEVPAAAQPSGKQAPARTRRKSEAAEPASRDVARALPVPAGRAAVARPGAVEPAATRRRAAVAKPAPGKPAVARLAVAAKPVVAARQAGAPARPAAKGKAASGSPPAQKPVKWW
jgi:hypothetical protein